MARGIAAKLSVEVLEGRALLSGVSFTLTTDQTTYQMGQPVQITYTETNNSDQTVTVLPSDYALELWHDGGELILQMPPWVGGNSANATTLGPDQSITEQKTWNGLWPFDPFNQDYITGTFQATIVPLSASGPGDVTADFQIVPPPAGTIVSSITAVQTGSSPDGPSETLTFTETNEGDEPVSVPTGPDGFYFVSDGYTNGIPYSYQSVSTGQPWSGSPNATWTTLQPGQSWTQMTLSSPNNEVVTDIYDLNGNATSFMETGDPSGSGTQPAGSKDSSTPGGSISAHAASMVSTGLATYKLGQDVRVTLTIPGGEKARLATPRARAREQITILDDTQVISRLTRRVSADKLTRLDAGRTVRVTKLWDGRPDQPGIQKLEPGAYTIDVVYGDYGVSTTVQIVRETP